MNSIQPGYVPTEVIVEHGTPELDRTLRRATPIGHGGTPDDIGRVAVFLATEGAGWITGQLIGVDGGLNIPVMPSMAPIARGVYGDDVVRAFALPDVSAPRDPVLDD